AFLNDMEVANWQWLVMMLFFGGFVFFAPRAKDVKTFFFASNNQGKQPGLWLLTSSLVISWIFAKSITNAADLGQKYGMVGGVAYAAYYLSFLVAGVVLYQLRVQGHFKSVHDFLLSRYGKTAVLVFSILIAFRLFNEVWSNTMVIGSYFGEGGSTGYYTAIVIFTVLTLIYTLKGGMRSSMITDFIQSILFLALLIILLLIIFPSEQMNFSNATSSGSWTLLGGLDLFLVALIQVFSYPFHDSVMTDRAFLSDAKTTRKAFIYSGIIGFVLILLFSFIGVFANINQLDGAATLAVAKFFGTGVMLAMNLIMITSAASTLDSAFSSFSKLIVLDVKWLQPLVANGRWIMILMALAGTVPVFLSPTILSATTISGTMVIGLAPVFLFWKKES
ncbi:MAG: sodium:solute symporter, partial [Bacteroidota bacterium]